MFSVDIDMSFQSALLAVSFRTILSSSGVFTALRFL
uniref:Uncharacterized protein n=1 Tax=Anguilla anguilla TaxID=7936 RepID=A0A0E9PRZ7_ANGAN